MDINEIQEELSQSSDYYSVFAIGRESRARHFCLALEDEEGYDYSSAMELYGMICQAKLEIEMFLAQKSKIERNDLQSKNL